MRLLFLTGFTCLAACAGGGSSPDRFVTFSERFDAVRASGVTPLAQLPTSGAVSYRGQMQLNLPVVAGEVVTGTMSLRVDFAEVSDAISGDVTGFVVSSGQALSGRLGLSNGQFDPTVDPATGYYFQADLDGVLSSNAGAWAIDAAIDGDFHGRSGEQIEGVVSGGFIGPAEDGPFDGRFVGTAE